MYDDVENPWLGGGGAVRLIEIYKRFPKGFNITVYTGNFPKAQDRNINGIKYKRIGLGLNYSISRFTYVISAISLLKRVTADIIIEDFSPYSPIFSQISRKSVVLFQNIFKIHLIKSKLLIGFLPYLSEQIYIKSSKSIIASSNKLAAIVKQINKRISNLATIPYGVDNHLFFLKPQEENFILFLGRLDIYQKGIDILLKAYNMIKNQIENTKIIIAGSGKDEIKVRQMISRFKLDNKIKMTGKVFGELKNNLLSNCLFLCMPSRFESWGIVAAEGMACAKPVIATSIEGLDEVVDPKTAIIVPPDNPKALADAMVKLFNNAILRKELGKKARQKAKQFDWNKRAQQTLEFYKQVIRGYEK